ncbi:MAG: hypothetical protein ACXWLM_07455, partial [Myxococcales bacterium]
FYVDNEAGPLEIKSLEPSSGAAGLLLDDAADATSPRPSRDGRRLLYISHQTDASGQLCVREFDEQGRPGERRCLSGEDEAVAQAEWFPDGQSIAALVRPRLAGDYAMVRYPLSGGRQPLLEGTANLGRPSISPDGKWLAYVPLKRVSAQVAASFAAEAARELALQRLDKPGEAPAKISFDLPGASAFLSFSADGRFLYFTQFLNDTNVDGVIDGNDNGVVFRAAFDGERVDAAHPQQLTSAEWNCQYPAPAADRFITTCLFEGSLHVYSLPLEGAVPVQWSRERIDDQLTASRGRWESLLLLAHRIAVEPADDHPRTSLRMIELHLALGELESAEFYARQLARIAPASKAAALSPLLLELIGHRRADAGLSRGELSEQFIAGARERLQRLAPFEASADPSVAALVRLVESEVHDALGEQPEAVKALSAVALEKVPEPLVLHLAAARAAAADRDLGSREPLLAVYRKLAVHSALDERERLDFADRYVGWLLRGKTAAEVGPLLDAEHDEPGGELGFRLDLERRLQGLTPQTQDEVRGRVFELYKANKSFDRRRALVDITVRRAARQDDDFLLYQFADTWVSYVKPEQAERRPAEDLYRQVVMERAYIERAAGKIGDARGHFYGVTLQTDSLEAHVGFIEQRFLEGHSEADVLKEYQQRFKPDDPTLQFAQAWLLARAPQLDFDQAQSFLKSAARTLWARFELQQLWGFVAHRRFLEARDPRAAEEASSHYRLALDLAGPDPRARAALLDDVAFLQARAGNHAIAIGFFDERDRLPFIDPLAELHHRVEKARSLFHLERRNEALDEIGKARKLIEVHPELSRFLPLVIDRSALYHLDAGRFAEAHALYDELLPSLQGPRNPFAARLGRAAASIGAGKPAEALADLDAAEPLIAAQKEQASYRILVAGLRAQAHASAGDLAGAIAAESARRDLLGARYEKAKLDEDALDLALSEAQLADWSWRTRDAAAAATHLEAAFARADQWAQSTGTPVFPLGLGLLDAAARMHFEGLQSRVDLAARLQAAQDRLSRLRNPDWAAARDRITTWLTRLELERR